MVKESGGWVRVKRRRLGILHLRPSFFYSKWEKNKRVSTSDLTILFSQFAENKFE